MDMNMEKYTIKFIDVILDLYLHIPYQVRNEMRNFQNNIMFGQLQYMQ